MDAPTLDGWDIVHGNDAQWLPWGGGDLARAKILGTADGSTIAFVEAKAGYEGTPHEHANTELFHLLSGVVRNQGQRLVAGDGYAAAAGSQHTDFVVEEDATYLSIFML